MTFKLIRNPYWGRILYWDHFFTVYHLNYHGKLIFYSHISTTVENNMLIRLYFYIESFSIEIQCNQCVIFNCGWNMTVNKANLRDLIAATGLVILLELDSNRRFFSPCDLEIWWMTLKNNRATLLYYIKLCASFQIHQWIQTGVTVRKHSIQVKIGNFWSRVTLKFDK